MKVNVNLTIEIDPQDYAAEYGLNVSEVRADIKTRVPEWVVQQFIALGFDDTTVEGK